MKKMRWIALLTAMIMVLTTACESSSGGGSASGADTGKAVVETGADGQTTISTKASADGGEKTIYLFQSKIEIDEALKNVAAKYCETHPGIKFVIESSGGSDAATALKTKFAGGEAPDIFTLAGRSEMQLWSDRLEDLADQPWVGDMVQIAKDNSIIDGKTYGFPVSIESNGIMYNKDLFEQAGITEIPKTLSELKTVVEKLEAAGIQPFVGAQMDWFQGYILVGMGCSRQPDANGFISGLNDGSATFVGNSTFTDLANYIIFESSKSLNPLNTDFNTQIATFASGKAAMSLGGNYNQPSINAINPDINMAMMGIPINENPEENDKLFGGVTGYWCVNKESQVKEEAKEFLSWLAMTEEGRECITKDLQFIPPFTSFQADEASIGNLGASTTGYIKDNKIYGLVTYYPDGFGQASGESVQKLIAGKVTIEEFQQELQDSWDNLKQ